MRFGTFLNDGRTHFRELPSLPPMSENHRLRVRDQCLIDDDRLELLQGSNNIAAKNGQVRLQRLRPPFVGSASTVWRQVEKIKPGAHFFVRSKYWWVTAPASVPQFQTIPGKIDPPLMSARSAARLAAVKSA